MGAMIKRLDRMLFPFFSAWAVVAYMHAIQTIYVFWKLPYNFAIWLFFAPVLLAEYFCSGRFRLMHSQKAKETIRSGILFPAFLANSFFWLVFFSGWVVFVGYFSRFNPAFQLYGTYFFALTLALWTSMAWMAIAGIAAWLIFYLYFTVKRGRFRIAASVIPYFFLTLCFFAHQWYLGGPGRFPAEKVAAQPGVVKLFDSVELQAAMDRDPMLRGRVLRPEWERFESKETIRAVPNARSIWVNDAQDTLFLTYGVTYVQQLTYPMLVRKDLLTGEIRYVLTDSNVRQTWYTEDSVFLAPWHDHHIYELDAKDLSIKRVIESQVRLLPILWEPMSVIKDIASERIVVATEFYPALLLYDLETGNLLHGRNLSAEGYMGRGDTAWCPVQSKKTGKMYFILTPGKADLIEVDPDNLEILRTLDLGWTLGTALALDEESGTLYFQSGVYNSLYAVDLKTFTVRRTYRGAVHARRLRLDLKRNAIYILDYSGGRLIALDLASGERAWELRMGGRPHGICIKGDTAWVHSMAGAFRVDLAAQWAGVSAKR
ncbi:MAG: PQQ-binding-like beta-propeller repeat protein [Deltaproteobacteria bacterium]|nr:PQQ-binding-like beta-propeller repeat protein [Deltaproteobacteria bacterium]